MPDCPRCRSSFPDEIRFCPYDGARLAASSRPLLGTKLDGRYQVLEYIGSGGNAQVYKAWHDQLGVSVALKILDGRDPRRIARFALEARAVSRIDHENVVSVLDFGYADGAICYIALEFVDGRPLSDEIERLGWIAPARATHILAQIAAGVGRAHEMGIIHRDLKPDNVMLTTRHGDPDFVKVLDFGLARAMEPNDEMPRLTRTGEIFGTPAFMAPEQWRGESIDARADVYAMGVLAYQTLTGRLPFSAPTIPKLMHMHLSEAAPPLRSVAPDASEMIEKIVMRALAKDPDRRYQTASDMLAVLLRACETFTPPSARTTYGRLGTTRPGGILHNLTLDVDGPQLCSAIEEIIGERCERVQVIVPSLWGTTPSALVDALLRAEEITEGAREVAGAVRRLRADMDRIEEDSRHEWAQLRGEIVDLHVALDVERQLLESDSFERPIPSEDEDPTRPMEYSFHPFDGMPQSVDPDLDTRRRDAERRLAESRARRVDAIAARRKELLRELRRMVERCKELQSAFDAILRHVQQRVDELGLPRSQAVELEASHGAIEAYLEMVREMVSAPRSVPRDAASEH